MRSLGWFSRIELFNLWLTPPSTHVLSRKLVVLSGACAHVILLLFCCWVFWNIGVWVLFKFSSMIVASKASVFGGFFVSIITELIYSLGPRLNNFKHNKAHSKHRSQRRHYVQLAIKTTSNSNKRALKQRLIRGNTFTWDSISSTSGLRVACRSIHTHSG